MTEHAPKLHALEAHARGLLSRVASVRVERHLEVCETCTKALEAVQAYEALREQASDESVPELSWERMSRALDAGVTRPAAPRRESTRAGRIIALAWPALAVAAAALIGWVALNGQREQARRTQPAVSAPAEQAAARLAPELLEARVTLVAGEVEQERAGARTRVDMHTVVREGDVLRAGVDGELHVATADGSGFVLGSDGELRVTHLRPHDIELSLERGTLLSEVRKLATGERYVVTASTYSAHVRGTLFSVSHREHVGVRVVEGQVEVMKGAASVAMLEAGQAFHSAGAVEAVFERRVHARGQLSLPWLLVPAMGQLSRVQLDEGAIVASGGFAMRAPPGDLAVAFADAGGRMHTVIVLVTAEGATLSEAMIEATLEQDRERVGTLAPEQISAVVRDGLEALRRCYERSLKQNPRLEGKLVLAMRIAPDGHVARAALKGAEVPRELESCVLAQARALRFPKPEGGPVSFEMPLNFKARK